MTAPRFPIDDVLPEVLAHLAVHPRLVLEAPPGAGKTTQVPLALRNAAWCTGRILMLEPRRIAARAAAAYMADCLGDTVGGVVGYRIRFERKVSAATRIEIVTEGILTRMVQDDPTLDGISAILFDEFHERHLASDLGLALCLDIQAGLRPDLRLVVMSATLEGERLARFLDAPRVTAAGRGHPVTVTALPAVPHDTPMLQLRRAVTTALAETAGDVLCFMPGKAEIARAARVLGEVDAEIDVLHGELNVADQARLLQPGPRRRVILATNVAESSITLPGVHAVVDTGLAREPCFDPVSGMSRLETVTISQASATQRAGRAGRVAPGRCYRLWPDSRRLDPATRPEMQRVDLAGLLLELKLWGHEALRFLDPPPAGALAQAQDLLCALGALDEAGHPTAHGRALAAFGAHPRLASAMLRAPAALQGLACDVAAIVEGRDPLRGDARRSDALARRVEVLEAWRARRHVGEDVERGALVAIEQAAQHWRRRVQAPVADAPTPHDVGHVLALAYPDRIGRQDRANPRRYPLSGGRGAQLLQDSELVGSPWLAIADIRHDARDARILRAAPLDPAVLDQAFPAAFTREHTLRFNPDTRVVEARETRRFSAIVLEDRLLPTPRDTAVADMLLAGIGDLGLDCLPWTDALREWQARVASLRAWCPELNLPALDDATLRAHLDAWLRPALEGCRAVADLTSQALAEALHARLDYAAQRALDEHAPREITVPSGQRRRLEYTAGEAPVLAVKLQEMFGLGDTPRIAKGRVPVLLHLLSPRQTPIQVTQDLRGFWERTYPDVKKELKGRYPKHPWPDDPWTATATHRAKPRGT
ncbi:MAG: ATP-dependent helicase HrpB [Gammaproteobacteria bacterium]